jgi:hypothetical protein
MYARGSVTPKNLGCFWQVAVGKKKGQKSAVTKKKSTKNKNSAQRKAGNKSCQPYAGNDLTAKLFATMEKHKEVMSSYLLEFLSLTTAQKRFYDQRSATPMSVSPSIHIHIYVTFESYDKTTACTETEWPPPMSASFNPLNFDGRRTPAENRVSLTRRSRWREHLDNDANSCVGLSPHSGSTEM